MRNPWAFSVRVRRGGFADTLARYGLSRPNAQYPTPNTHPTPNIQRPTETLARRTCARCRPSGLEPGCPHPGRWQSQTPAGLRAGRLQADANLEHPDAGRWRPLAACVYEQAGRRATGSRRGTWQMRMPTSEDPSLLDLNPQRNPMHHHTELAVSQPCRP